MPQVSSLCSDSCSTLHHCAVCPRYMLTSISFHDCVVAVVKPWEELKGKRVGVEISPPPWTPGLPNSLPIGSAAFTQLKFTAFSSWVQVTTSASLRPQESGMLFLLVLGVSYHPLCFFTSCPHLCKYSFINPSLNYPNLRTSFVSWWNPERCKRVGDLGWEE